MRTDGSLPAAGGPVAARRGGTVALVALLLGIGAIVLGFDAALYAEYGGREGTEESISCDPQPDGSCSGLLERQAEREPRLVAKMNELGRHPRVGRLGGVAGGSPDAQRLEGDQGSRTERRAGPRTPSELDVGRGTPA